MAGGPPRAGGGGGGWRTIALPIAFALVAVALLAADHPLHANEVGVLLAAASLLAVLVRLVLTFADNLRMLQASRIDALTDALTGLGNRRQLAQDLASALSGVSPERRLALALFDLNGFKHYNDTFGHRAGDAVLARLGRKLASATAGHGAAYRMGGDEFCVLVDAVGDDGRAVVDAATAALSERGESFELSSSRGSVVLPDEAPTPESALRLADQRMYRQKRARAGSPSRQTTDVLLRALSERHPDLDGHLRGVAELVEATARRLGVAGDELDYIRLAGDFATSARCPCPMRSSPGPDR